MSELESRLSEGPSATRGRSQSVVQQRYPTFHKIRTFLKKYDQFAFTPAPRFEREKQVSLRGLIGTCVSVALLFVYFGMSLSRFLDGIPSVSQVQQPPDADSNDFVPTGIVFRINDDSGIPRRIFYNESYFKFVASITNVTEQDRFPRSVEQVPMVPCDVSSWGGWLGAEAMCPNVTFQVRGRYQSDNYTFSRLDVLVCDSHYPYNASDGSGPVTCADQNSITQLINNGRFNLLQSFESDIPGVDSSWEANMYLINAQAWSLYEQSYAIRYTSVNPNYITSFQEADYQQFQMVSEKSYMRAPIGGGSAGGRYALTIYFRLGSFNMQEDRVVDTIMDFLGQMWAFFGLVLAVFALYFARYNEDKFYEENPGWDEIDAQFRSRYDREHAQADGDQSYRVPVANQEMKTVQYLS